MSSTDLIGTWGLRHFELVFPDGNKSYPYGEDVTGLLIYDDTGHMSAAFGSAKRQTGSTDDLEEVGGKVAFDNFMAYCGPFKRPTTPSWSRSATSSTTARACLPGSAAARRTTSMTISPSSACP